MRYTNLVLSKTIASLSLKNDGIYAGRIKTCRSRKFGGDAQAIEVIRELIAQKSVDSLIEKAAYFGRFLEVAHRFKRMCLK